MSDTRDDQFGPQGPSVVPQPKPADPNVPVTEDPAVSTVNVLELKAPPSWMVTSFLLLVTLTWVPLVFIARARVTTSTKPRIHLFQDMDVQPRYDPQATSPVFADGRAMRPEIPGTIARGDLYEDDHYELGYTTVRNSETGEWEVSYFDGIPDQVDMSEATARRGQEMFRVYCSVCHGMDGYGEGPVHKRAVELEEPRWVPPTSMHTETVRGREDGHLYNTIANGIRNMPGYGHQISIPDRWAIVLYLRALQRSQNASIEDVPAEQRDDLR